MPMGAGYMLSPVAKIYSETSAGIEKLRCLPTKRCSIPAGQVELSEHRDLRIG